MPPVDCGAAYMWMSCDSTGQKGRKKNPQGSGRLEVETHTHLLTKDQHHKHTVMWSDSALHNVLCYWPNILVSLRLCSWLPPYSDSGTLKAAVAHWGASEGWTSSPQGEREADISGTLDVIETFNWTTACTVHDIKYEMPMGKESALSGSQFSSFSKHLCRTLSENGY